MSPVSINYGVVPGYAIFWGLFALALAIFLQRVYQLGQYLRLGRQGEKVSGLGKRALVTLVNVIGQWCQWKNLSRQDRASLGHVLMAWGFLIFVLFYFIFIVIGAGFGISAKLNQTSFFFFYLWVMDIVSVFIIIAAAWGIIRRYVVRPARLKGEQTMATMGNLIPIFILPIPHLFKEATSIALGQPPVGFGAILPPVSSALSNLFQGSAVSTLQAAHIGFFWAHWGIVLFLLAFIPYSHHFHMIASVPNIFFRYPTGVALRPIDLEKAESFGAAQITDFTRKQLLDLYACVVCGQCQERCPATASGKALNPKKVIQDLKKHLLAVGPALVKAKTALPANPDRTIPGKVVTEDEIWGCTTCRACDEVCPVSVEHIDKIIDLRRHLVMEKSQLPESAQEALKSLGTRGHPWRGTTATRTDWASGLGIKVLAEDSHVDLLYWVGCTGALDERNMKVSVAMARILKTAGINFGILGAEEGCCGDPARRMGDEYLFQTLCQKNIALFQQYNVRKILTTCPHGYNAFKNEYPQFGGNFEVIHHTQFIADSIRQGKLKLRGLEGNKAVAYHDACYLGRYNDIYQAPRDILAAISGIKRAELARAKSSSFCCGGGGGYMWLEEEPTQRVNARRTEDIIKAKVDLITSACPFCLTMFEDGLKTKGVAESIKAMDLSELVAQLL